MAKKARKKVAAKASKPAKRAVKRKAAAAKAPRKAATAKKAKPAAKKKPIVVQQPAQPPRSLVQKIEGVVGAVIDTLTDAERLHHKLDPGVPPIPE